jgi:opacity protein-like surface antigen
MSRKFAMVPAFGIACIAVLMAAQGHAQQTPPGQDQAPATQTPATQPPAAQAPDSTQTPEEESPTRRKKVRAHDYQKWTFNVGVGDSLPSGSTYNFVKGGGLLGTAGVARNANKYLGLRADFFWVNLPLRDSSLLQASAPGAHNSVYGLTVDPIINIPVTRKYSGYVLIGPDFFHRGGKLDSSTAVPGSPCNAFWVWWGVCSNTSIPLSGRFVNSSQNEFGFNFGGGVTRKIRGNLEVYGEVRYLHAKNNNISTDVRPLTIGIRW